ncbi:MAG: penicillin-binding transpeptidase domain-containing protein [Dissulfuribacterales bacterium]
MLSYRRIPGYAVLLCVLVLIVYGVFTLPNKMLFVPGETHSRIFADNIENFDKRTLQKINRMMPFTNVTNKRFALSTGGKTYEIRSSLSPSLQNFIIEHIDRKNSRFFAFVAIEADTGRILSMVSYDKNNPDSDICTNPDYPAASLFKIITSAAAIEKFGFNCNTPVTFNGNKYTLYKTQLKDRLNKYTNRISFKEAFADSINPVFGKIGIHLLGKSALETYATAFGFNKTFDFEIPLKPSCLTINDDPYNWAEIACGFNNKTRISPLHGALMVSIILNDGKLIEPTLIDNIIRDNQMVYQRNSHAAAQIIKPHTSITLKKLMNASITSGTASKSFSGFKKDSILSKLNIGGKTGSINNNAQHLKYDWFEGFAEEKNGLKKIITSVLVVHDKYIGIRAARYSRMAIKEYFKNYYAKAEINKHAKNSTSL